MDFLGELPTEVAHIILCYLTAEQLEVCSYVSRRWRLLVNDEHIWAKILPMSKYFPTVQGDPEGAFRGMCPTMKKYLKGKRWRSNWSEGKCKTMELDLGAIRREFDMNCWLSDGRLYSCDGSDLGLAPFEGMSEEDLHMSPDFLYLVGTYRGIVLLFNRSSVKQTFTLVRAFAAHTRSGENPTGDVTGWMYMVSWPRSRRRSEPVRQFLLENESKVKRVVRRDSSYLFFFTGFDSLEERRLCLMSRTGYGSIFIWDIHRDKMARCWDAGTGAVYIIEGWDRRGICVKFDKMVVFYDVDGQHVQTIDLRATPWTVYGPQVMTEANVVVMIIKKNDPPFLNAALWEKQQDTENTTGLRILGSLFTSDSKGLLLGPDRSNACMVYHFEENSLQVLAAPDWEPAALILCPDLSKNYISIHILNFADGYALVMVKNDKGDLIGYDVDLTKRNVVISSAGRKIEHLGSYRIISVTDQSLLAINDYDRKLLIKNYVKE